MAHILQPDPKLQIPSETHTHTHTRACFIAMETWSKWLSYGSLSCIERVDLFHIPLPAGSITHFRLRRHSSCWSQMITPQFPVRSRRLFAAKFAHICSLKCVFIYVPAFQRKRPLFPFNAQVMMCLPLPHLPLLETSAASPPSHPHPLR